MVIEMRGNQLFMILAVLKANEYYKENSVCCFESVTLIKAADESLR